MLYHEDEHRMTHFIDLRLTLTFAYNWYVSILINGSISNRMRPETNYVKSLSYLVSKLHNKRIEKSNLDIYQHIGITFALNDTVYSPTGQWVLYYLMDYVVPNLLIFDRLSVNTATVINIVFSIIWVCSHQQTNGNSLTSDSVLKSQPSKIYGFPQLTQKERFYYYQIRICVQAIA